MTSSVKQGARCSLQLYQAAGEVSNSTGRSHSSSAMQAERRHLAGARRGSEPAKHAPADAAVLVLEGDGVQIPRLSPLVHTRLPPLQVPVGRDLVDRLLRMA